MNILGGKSKTVFLAATLDQLGVECQAAAAIKQGQVVRLNDDGKVQPWVPADLKHLAFGVALFDAAIGELVTIRTVGHSIIYALSNGALVAGPVAQNSYDSATDVAGLKGYAKYVAGVATTHTGFNLDQATGANELIRVVIIT